MSIQTEYDRRTADRIPPNAPDTYEIAAELGVDAALLREFVRHHPNPTAPIVLGWANRYTDADPAVYAESVERWLVAYTERNRTEATPVSLDDVLDDGRIGSRGWR